MTGDSHRPHPPIEFYVTLTIVLYIEHTDETGADFNMLHKRKPPIYPINQVPPPPPNWNEFLPPPPTHPPTDSMRKTSQVRNDNRIDNFVRFTYFRFADFVFTIDRYSFRAVQRRQSPDESPYARRKFLETVARPVQQIFGGQLQRIHARVDLHRSG